MLKNKEKETITKEDSELEEMMKAGLHFGHKKTKKNPKMEQYIFGVRNGINIIDVSKTRQKLNEALDFLSKSISDKKEVLLVGTKVQYRDLIKEIAEECQLPYVNERWLGGMITNFEIIKKRVDHLKDLEEKKQEGDLEKYTKKERIKIDREIESLKLKFEGIKSLSKIPSVIFVIDVVHDDLAVKEARSKNVKIAGIVDSDGNPEIIDYPIPANDDALSSVRYILEKFKETILGKQKESQKKVEKSEVSKNIS